MDLERIGVRVIARKQRTQCVQFGGLRLRDSLQHLLHVKRQRKQLFANVHVLLAAVHIGGRHVRKQHHALAALYEVQYVHGAYTIHSNGDRERLIEIDCHGRWILIRARARTSAALVSLRPSDGWVKSHRSWRGRSKMAL